MKKKDRTEEIRSYVAKAGIDIFLKSHEIDPDNATANVVCIVTMLFDGIASSFEETSNGAFTFDDMVEILRKTHAVTSGNAVNKMGIVNKLINGLNLN